MPKTRACIPALSFSVHVPSLSMDRLEQRDNQREKLLTSEHPDRPIPLVYVQRLTGAHAEGFSERG